MPQLTCPVCGISFHAVPARIRKAKGRLCCSRKCRAKYMTKPRSPKRPKFPSIDTQCAQCGKAIKVKVRRYKKFKRHFCSYECFGKHKSEHSQATYRCEYCGKDFTIKPSRKQGKHKYCSFECFNNHRLYSDEYETKVEVHCSNCNAEMLVHPVKVRQNKHHYCSIECRAEYIRGKNNPAYVHGEGRHIYYGTNWKAARGKALKRDCNTCQHCGKQPKNTRNLHVHHIVKAGLFDNREEANDLFNLITLCQTCHKKAEAGKIIIQRKLL